MSEHEESIEECSKRNDGLPKEGEQKKMKLEDEKVAVIDPVWEEKCERVVEVAKLKLLEEIKSTEKFEQQFMEMKRLNNYTVSELKEERVWLRLDILVDRIVPARSDEAKKEEIYADAINALLDCLVKAGFLKEKDEEIQKRMNDDGLIEKQKMEGMNNFISWWKEYVDTNKCIWEPLLELNYISNWLASNGESTVVEWVRMGTMEFVLRKMMRKRGFMPSILISRIGSTILSEIRSMCDLEFEPLTVAEFAFHAVEYVDKTGAVQKLSKYVDTCANFYQHDDFRVMVGPFFNLRQSSGYGKSRILIELGKVRPVLYISFDNIKVMGYPSRSTPLIEKLFPVNVTTRMDVTAMHNAVSITREYFEKHNKSPTPLNYKKVYSNLKNARVNNQRRKSVVILVIDEPRELFEMREYGMNMFDRVCKFLRDSWKDHSIFGIFVDGYSRNSYHDPKILRYSSDLYVVPRPRKFFHPYILTNIFDIVQEITITDRMKQIFKNRQTRRSEERVRNENEQWDDVVKHDELSKNWKSVYALQNLGRPMWKWCFDDAIPYGIFGSCGGEGQKRSFEAYIAILFCRVGGKLSYGSEISNKLVVDHMATLLDCSVTHLFQAVEFISDPYLAYKVQNIWYRGAELKSDLLPAARRAFYLGIIEKDDTFEARVVLLCILDGLRCDDAHEWKSVSTFLQLFGKYSHALNIPENAKMSVVQFLTYTKPPTSSDLEYLVKRRSAAILNRHQLLLPYFYESEELQYGYILVHVTNLQLVNAFQVYENLQPSAVFKNKSTRFVSSFSDKSDVFPEKEGEEESEQSKDDAQHSKDDAQHSKDDVENANECTDLADEKYTKVAAGIMLNFAQAQIDDSELSTYELPMATCSNLKDFSKYLHGSECILNQLIMESSGSNTETWNSFEKVDMKRGPRPMVLYLPKMVHDLPTE